MLLEEKVYPATECHRATATRRRRKWPIATQSADPTPLFQSWAFSCNPPRTKPPGSLVTPGAHSILTPKIPLQILPIQATDRMNALRRLRKGGARAAAVVPRWGREKRGLLQASRQRAARGTLLRGLRAFLTADSFMYGPLLQPQQQQGQYSPPKPGTHPDGAEGEANGICRSSTGRVQTKDRDEGSLEEEGNTSSMTSSYDDHDDHMTPLDNEMACKVVQMLLTKVGGRYSTELGLNLDAGDEEVEKWFLAVTLFHRHLTFDILKNTFQKLESAGIVSVRGTLNMEEDDIADILETAGYTIYKHRAAARIRRLAVQLESEHEGRVTSLKHVQDPHELCRHISNLHGLISNTCNVFLRELRGIWPGAAADYDRRTNRAAVHLRIVECGKSEELSNKSSAVNPHISFKQIAHEAGVDERDIEVALVKFGLAHERHYRDCSGGPVCNFLVANGET